jgi:hypothetical protein
MQMKIVTLVSCGADKLSQIAPAEDLYTSPLFKMSRHWAERSDEWFILSAKHGLLDPKSLTAPYDVSLRELDHYQRVAWADAVTGSVVSRFPEPSSTTVVILAGSFYVGLIETRLLDRGYIVLKPLYRLPIGRRLRYLSRVPSSFSSWVLLETLYFELGRLQSGGFGPRCLRPGLAWPARGVYFFFEPGETRSNGWQPRVTRVGTHAVSRGSRTTVWNRLKTHYGDGAGGGAHRSSIFRQHVGASVATVENCSLPVSWGVRKTASPEELRDERPLEGRVSQVIRSMSVVVVPVLDEPTAWSDRAYIERNSIGILSTIGSEVDPASRNWIGRGSPRSEIRDAGLWNLDHIGRFPDQGFAAVLHHLVEAARSNQSATGTIAPWGWHPSQSLQQPLFGPDN